MTAMVVRVCSAGVSRLRVPHPVSRKSALVNRVEGIVTAPQRGVNSPVRRVQPKPPVTKLPPVLLRPVGRVIAAVRVAAPVASPGSATQTYAMRGWDTGSARFVYWITDAPGDTPASTDPAATGPIANKMILGVSDP